MSSKTILVPVDRSLAPGLARVMGSPAAHSYFIKQYANRHLPLSVVDADSDAACALHERQQDCSPARERKEPRSTYVVAVALADLGLGLYASLAAGAWSGAGTRLTLPLFAVSVGLLAAGVALAALIQLSQKVCF